MDDQLLAILTALYRRQSAALEAAGDVPSWQYLLDHGRENALRRQLETVRRFLPFVEGRVLEWGCMHAPDATLLRLLGRADLDIDGCDVFPAGHFGVFHDFAGVRYTPLDHPWRLPYADDSFGTVLADGVLEHAPNDGESLTELYRVLEPGGCLIVCCLPNRWSLAEAAARWLDRPHHLRTYSLGQVRSMLLHHGFRPFELSYHQVVPRRAGAWLWRCNALLERLWPINRLASNLFVVAEKCRAIHSFHGALGRGRRMRGHPAYASRSAAGK
jgi:SAM-dependent methyltransferase